MAELSTTRDLLDPAAVNKADTLGVIARTVVEGYKVGEHRSPLKGFAIEFAQHREYTPGDDVRHLDWKLLGRSEKLYLKQYEQDTNYHAHILLDTSGSMNYGSGKWTKLHYAKVVSAALSYAILNHRDAVSIGLFNADNRVLMPRTDTPNGLPMILETLATAEAQGETALADNLSRLAPAIRRRSIVFILSDLLDDEEALLSMLPQFRFKGTEVVVMHILDPAELDLPFKDTVRFEGLEGEETLETQPADFRESYKSVVKEFCDRMRLGCERQDCHYVLADTSHSPGEMIGTYLAFRHRTKR